MQQSIDFLNVTEEPTIELVTEEDKPSFLEGICPQCLDSGFKHDVKDGVLGVCYTTLSQDASGNPIKQLMVCNHTTKINI